MLTEISFDGAGNAYRDAVLTLAIALARDDHAGRYTSAQIAEMSLECVRLAHQIVSGERGSRGRVALEKLARRLLARVEIVDGADGLSVRLRLTGGASTGGFRNTILLA